MFGNNNNSMVQVFDPKNVLTTTVAPKLSRAEYRRQKDLEAARIAGTIPAEKDAEGKDINPHIPEYISRAPWYMDAGGSALSHQRMQREPEAHEKLEQWYDRGAKAGPAAKKFRKGACENCGAMSHKRQDCVERPRKRGAKFTGKNIQADEVIQHFDRDYDAKRDRWNGYDPSTYKRTVVDEYEAAEEARQKYKEEHLDKQGPTETVTKKAVKEKKEGDDEFGSSDEDEEDDEKYVDTSDQVGQKVDQDARMTVRNLRIREDTAKYLINLDPESAYYDPKTRAMRDPAEKGVPLEQQRYAGDNFERYGGDVTNMQKLQLFAQQSASRGNNVHAQGNPTAGELLMKEFNQKKAILKDTSKQSILAKYGGEEYLERPAAELLNGSSEGYVEYSRSGQIIKGREKAKARSKYDEDIYPNNHKSVWGSWYDRGTGAWGFACCHSIISGSYCTGEAGKSATESSSAAALLQSAAEQQQIEDEAEAERKLQKRKTLAEEHQESLEGDKGKKRKDREGKGEPSYVKPSTRIGDDPDNVVLDKERLRKAIADERKRKELGEDEAWAASKKRTTDVSQEELEAYRLSRQAYDDPMANYKDTEE